MITVLEAVDDLILESNASVRMMSSVIDRYIHSHSNIKDFFKSLFSSSHKNTVWDNMINSKLLGLKEDLERLHNTVTHEHLKDFIDKHVLTSGYDVHKIKVFGGEPLAKRIEDFLHTSSNISNTNIIEDLKIAIFLKYFGSNNQFKFLTETENFKLHINKFFSHIENASFNISSIRDQIVEYLVDESTKVWTFLDIDFFKAIIASVFLDTVAVRVIKHYLEPFLTNTPQKEEILPEIQPEQFNSSNIMMPIAGVIGAVGAGLGAYSLYKKYKKNPVRFQNFI